MSISRQTPESRLQNTGNPASGAITHTLFFKKKHINFRDRKKRYIFAN
jgi:hypothetical protein